MKINQRIEEEVERTLYSINNIERANPRPFFLTRLQARLDQRTGSKPVEAWVFRPAYMAALLGLVLLLNVSVMVYVQERIADREQEQEAISLSAEWGFGSNTINR